MANPPPLPPRSISQASPPSSPDSIMNSYDLLTPEAASRRGSLDRNYPYLDSFNDPRTTSTQSLGQVKSRSDNRRTLLVIYIHGFLGDETSFKSFPAHVHNLLAVTLSETHTVYSKIYPRYRSRKKISVARDGLSEWLIPHESPDTDVVLIGHSLGGILAAEVALLESQSPSSNDLRRHRILGLVAFDTPFLGMHPGVVKTGIASLFRSSPDPKTAELTPTESMASLSTTSSASDPFSPPEDPNYNPSYFNDVHLARRKGKWERGWYFWNKHSGDIRKAAKSYVTSHLEFGGCLADYPALRRRYDAMRALEDVDEAKQQRSRNGRLSRRVRFVNYYSASSGRIKESKNKALKDQAATNLSLEVPMEEPSKSADSGSNLESPPPSPLPSPRLPLQEYKDGEVISKDISTLNIDSPEDTATDPNASRSSNAGEPPTTAEPNVHESENELELPPIPDLPEAPLPFDGSKYGNSDVREIAQKDYKRRLRAYESAKQDRDELIQDRETLLQKRKKQPQKEDALTLLEPEQTEDQDNEVDRTDTVDTEATDEGQSAAAEEVTKKTKKQRDRKFCTLPSKDSKTGRRDPTWIRVYMEGIDEVVAHTSMFLMSETYAKLVGDTAARIEEWVKEDATQKAVLEAMNYDTKR